MDKIETFEIGDKFYAEDPEIVESLRALQDIMVGVKATIMELVAYRGILIAKSADILRSAYPELNDYEFDFRQSAGKGTVVEIKSKIFETELTANGREDG